MQDFCKDCIFPSQGSDPFKLPEIRICSTLTPKAWYWASSSSPGCSWGCTGGLPVRLPPCVGGDGSDGGIEQGEGVVSDCGRGSGRGGRDVLGGPLGTGWYDRGAVDTVVVVCEGGGGQNRSSSSIEPLDVSSGSVKCSMHSTDS